MDIIDVAVQQIGANGADRSHMKFLNWYGGFGNGTPWCAIFVSYCANQAGISTSIVPKYASCRVGMQWFVSKGKFKYKGQYIPKRGDIVFFLSAGRSHTGIVEKVSNNMLYTIEGNSGNKVAKRSYPLSHATITGYGVPDSVGSSNSGTSTDINSTKVVSESDKADSKKKKAAEELKYLNQVLANKKNSSIYKDTNQYDIKESNANKNIRVDIIIQNGKNKFIPVILDDVVITYERIGTPGKLEFSCMVEYKIQEGNRVLVCVDSKEIFAGFVFTRSFTKEKTMKVTVYNQLRYLKNKDSYIYSKKTASQLIKMVADDYKLTLGTIVDTKHAITRYEDNQTLFDIIQNSLDETLMMKGKMYVLYDEVGKLMLKNVSKMKLKTLIDEETGENYNYKTTIDANVYNQVKLAYENKKTGTLDLYIEKDSNNISKWGFLQYFDKIDDPSLGKLKAGALLNLYNQKSKSLSLSGVIGNVAVKAGSLLPIRLDLGELKICNYMMVEKVTHKFLNREHRMDLTLKGGEFGD